MKKKEYILGGGKKHMLMPIQYTKQPGACLVVIRDSKIVENGAGQEGVSQIVKSPRKDLYIIQ